MTNYRAMYLAAALLIISTQAYATTTIVVDNDQPAPVRTEVVTVTEVDAENKEEFTGVIKKVNVPKGYIGVIDDSNGKFRRITLKGGMINQYKVDDHVRIHLRRGMNEAKSIKSV